MEVQLTPQLERLVHEKVQSGRYGSASEVVCEALLLLEEREEARVAELARLRSRIDQSLLEAERGEVTDGDEFMEGLIRELDASVSDRRSG